MKNTPLILIYTIVFSFLLFETKGQTIVVKSFRKVGAIVHTESTLLMLNNPIRPKCTIIRVLNDQSGFTFAFGSIGNFVQSEQKEGEQQFVLPVGAKSVKITNKKRNLVCNYPFGIDLGEYMYEMVLGIDSTMKRQNDSIKTQWVLIKSFPTSAKIYIDGYATGPTPYDGSLTVGFHNVKVVNSGEVVDKMINVKQGDSLPFRFVFETHDYITEDALKNEKPQQYPEFKGGLDAFFKFIKDNMQNPALIWDSDVQGTVIVQFVISETGRVSNVKILRGIGGGCDEEAILLTKMMPNWIPAQLNGKAVPCIFQIPIKFNIQESN